MGTGFCATGPDGLQMLKMRRRHRASDDGARLFRKCVLIRLHSSGGTPSAKMMESSAVAENRRILGLQGSVCMLAVEGRDQEQEIDMRLPRVRVGLLENIDVLPCLSFV